MQASVLALVISVLLSVSTVCDASSLYPDEDLEPELTLQLSDEAQFYRARRVPLSLLVKRALSLFTQWRPFNSVSTSRDRNSPLSESAFVSAVSRGYYRPLGQPLRWGK